MNKPVTADEVRTLRAGDAVRMPCDPERWLAVVIDCGALGHGGEIPLEIKKVKRP